MAIVILSPHLDDAVLSCWHVLAGPGELIVINVFAGVPTVLTAPAWWDRYTGATDSAERVRERIEEDRRALALAGRTAVNLDFLDEQYRDGEQPLEALTDEIGRRLPRGAVVYAPAAIGNHADHALVRAAALPLRAAGFVVSLYADLPHANAHGWPGWVTSSHTPESKDLAGAAWEHALAGSGAMTPTVRELGPEARSRKLEVVAMYGTQVDALAEFIGRPLNHPEALGYEVTWATGAPARAATHAAHRLSGPRRSAR
jgi:LmbE family N-acetylglucosaminyl deacetylase